MQKKFGKIYNSGRTINGNMISKVCKWNLKRAIIFLARIGFHQSTQGDMVCFLLLTEQMLKKESFLSCSLSGHRRPSSWWRRILLLFTHSTDVVFQLCPRLVDLLKHLGVPRSILVLTISVRPRVLLISKCAELWI